MALVEGALDLIYCVWLTCAPLRCIQKQKCVEIFIEQIIEQIIFQMHF